MRLLLPFYGISQQNFHGQHFDFCYVFSLTNILFNHIPKHSIRKYSQLYPKLSRKETIFLFEIWKKNKNLKCQISANPTAAGIGLDKWKQFSFTFKNITIISSCIKMKSHIETTVILPLWKRVATVKEAERGSKNLKHHVIHPDFVQHYVSNCHFWWIKWCLLTSFSISPAQTQTPLNHFLSPVSVKPTFPQNLFQILQIKFLCLQCLSFFLQYIHISDLPLNTIIVHLASNYSNRKTGNHCHSDWKINVAQRYFYSFYGVPPSLDARTLESQGKFQIILGFIFFFF